MKIQTFMKNSGKILKIYVQLYKIIQNFWKLRLKDKNRLKVLFQISKKDFHGKFTTLKSKTVQLNTLFKVFYIITNISIIVEGSRIRVLLKKCMSSAMIIVSHIKMVQNQHQVKKTQHYHTSWTINHLFQAQRKSKTSGL